MSEPRLRVLHDDQVCVTIGACEAAAPELFVVEDDGTLWVAPEVPPEQRAAAEEAVRSCPTRALTLVTEPQENP